MLSDQNMNKATASAIVGTAGRGEITARAFPNFQQRVAIAQECAWASAKELSDLRSRLGIPNQFAPPIGAGVDEPEVVGEVDGLTRAIERLTDTVRDIRGLAETINSQL